MCVTINSLKEFFDTQEKTELLGAPLGADDLMRWECLWGRNRSLLPDTVYISGSLENVKRQPQSSSAHLVFCAGPGFEKS